MTNFIYFSHINTATNFKLYAARRQCNSVNWLNQKGLSLSECWEKVKCSSECDLSDGLFMYDDGSQWFSDGNCGYPTTSDCKANNRNNDNDNIYQYIGSK